MPGRLSVNQFNKSVSGTMGSSAALFQQLHLWADTQQKKSLTRVEASSISDASPIAAISRVFRLVVCTGPVAPNVGAGALTLLDFSPINPLSLQGVSRIIYDQVIQGAADLVFDDPIEVAAGEQLNVLMGFSYAVGDTTIAPSTSIGYLSWQGWEGQKQSQDFPYRLRS